MLMRCEPEPVVKPCGSAGVGGESVRASASASAATLGESMGSSWAAIRFSVTLTLFSMTAEQADGGHCYSSAFIICSVCRMGLSIQSNKYRVKMFEEKYQEKGCWSIRHNNYWASCSDFCFSKPHVPASAPFWNKNSPNSATSKHLQLLNNGGRCNVWKTRNATHEC